MNEQLIRISYSKVVNVLIFIFPIVIITLQVAGDLVLLILAMMGIYVAISQKLSPFIIKDIKVFSYLAIGYFSAVCLSVLFSGQAKELAHYIPRDFAFLFAPFIALALYKAEININFLILGAKVALLVIGAIVINQLLSGFRLEDRPSGVMNAGVLGNLVVSIFFTILVFFQHESFKHKIFTFLSLLSGLFVIVAAGTRGAWLSFLILSVAYFYFYCKQKTKFRSKLIIIIVLIIATVVLAVSFNQPLKDKVYRTKIEISSWLVPGEHPRSVGVRLGIYKKAADKIKEVPFFGHGYRTSNIVLFQNDSSSLAKTAVKFNHLHNAFLTNYYNGGVVLLGALLLLLFAPLRIFIKANSQDRKNPIFILGVMLTLGYASFGMVNILLGDTYMNGFYVFFLAFFLLLTNKSINTSQVSKAPL